jgi:hypothetical protein
VNTGVGQLFVLSLFPFRHSARCKLLLARALGVAVNFLRSLVNSDRHDLAAAELGRTGLSHKLIHFDTLPKGSHFAAWEQPELFSEEVRVGFRPLRK